MLNRALPPVALLFGLTACGSTDPEAGSSGLETENAAPPYVAGSCTPAPPGGLDVGDTVLDAELLECAGSAVQVHSLCGPRATLVVQYYGWCPPCFRHIELARELQAQYSADGLATLVVVVEDPLGDKADAEYCAGLRNHFDFDAWFLRDPEAYFEEYDDEGLVMVLDGQMRIEFLRTNASDDAIRDAVASALEDD